MTEDSKEENLLNSNYLAVDEHIAPDTSTQVHQLDNTLYVSPNMTVDGTCIFTAALPAELASSFPEGTVLQILPDSTILAVPPVVQDQSHLTTNNTAIIFKDSSFPLEFANDQNSAILPNLLVPSKQNETHGTEVPICSVGNISDIDLSFLNETEEPSSKSLNVAEVKELQSMIDIVQPNSLGALQNSIIGCNLELPQEKPESPDHPEGSTEDVVMIDVSKPIQLSQNSLIMVNGRKCILQQDTQTGQVIAYPVKEPDKPRRKRGRPRKASTDQVEKEQFLDLESVISIDVSEDEKEKGLLEIVNDDGSLVRRSLRKRKKAKVLKDYETGNLKQELGSDVEDSVVFDEIENLARKKKHKGPGRPRKYAPPQPTSTISDPVNENMPGKRPRGRPRKPILENEPTQAFLVQTADGQTLMMQVPLSSIPNGVSLQEVAQCIANKLNIGLNNSSNYSEDNVQSNSKEIPSEISLNENSNADSENGGEPAVQDHAIGSTTNCLNADHFIDEGHADDNVDSSCQNIMSNFDEIVVDSVCQSDKISEVTMIGTKPINNKVNNFLPHNILENHFSHIQVAPCSEVDVSENIPTSNSSIGISSINISSLPAQICVNHAEERDLGGNVTPEQFTKEFLLDGDFLKDKVNIHMLLQNVEASTEESPSEIQIQHCDEVSSVLPDDLPLNSSDTFEYSSQTVTVDKNDVQTTQKISSFPNSNKSLESYNFLSYNAPDTNCKINTDKDSSRNLAIISSIEHDHDFLIQAKRCSDVYDHQTTTSSATELTFIDSDIHIKTNSLENILSLENITPILRSSTLCDSENSQTQHLSDIILPSQETEIAKCKICHRTFSSDDELIQHFKSSHPKCICNQCDYMAEHGYVIKRHSLRHLSTGCICKICGKRYKDHYILKMHIKMVHLPAEAIFTCDICSKTFNRKAHLKRHLRIHEPNRPYKCSLCNYRAVERSDITKHLLVHETPKHKCHICGKSFRHTKNKELHLKRHYKQRDYKCGICDFYGYTFTDIRKHIERRHAGTKSFSCEDCGLLFKNKEALEEHKNSDQCQMCILEQELTTKDPILSEEKKDLEDVHLDMLDESEQSSVVNECMEVKLESSNVVNSGEEILTSAQSRQLIINGFENSDFLGPETLSLIQVDGDSSKLVTLVSTSGKSITLPLKNVSSESFENMLTTVSSNSEETFTLPEIVTDVLT